MLLQFSCTNHKSIKEKVVFSAIAGTDTTFEKSLIKLHDGKRVSRVSVFYGANGSGKSNLLDAVSFVRGLVIHGMQNQPGDKIFVKPHKMSSESTPSDYSIHFIKDRIQYIFGFSVINGEVIEEYLYYSPKGRQTKIYERERENYLPGDKYKGQFDSCLGATSSNRLFLSCAANLTQIEEVKKVFSFFRDDILIFQGGSELHTQGTIDKIYDDDHTKKLIIKWMNYLGTPIEDIVMEKISLSMDGFPAIFAEDIKREIVKFPIKIIDTRIVYRNFDVNLSDESSGIKKLIDLIYPIINAIRHDKVLFCDELECNLHEAIVRDIVNLFCNPNLKHEAQLFFTTHDTSILSLDTFRRDQVWFTELKHETRSTDLYSLVEIRKVRKEENVARGYISGKYGAIPMLNKEFSSLVSALQEGKSNG